MTMKNDLNVIEDKNIDYNNIVLKIGLPLIVLLACIFFLYSMTQHDGDYTVISNQGQRIEQSIYYKYDGKVYAMIPSGGYYRVEGADTKTFKVVDADIPYNKCVAVDKNNVYFGNKIIKDLNPKAIYSIGNGYYSDGKSTYFCSNQSERNTDLSWPMEVIQSMEYIVSKDKKPQSYIYPYQKLATKRSIKKFDRLIYFATDGKNLYYKGKPLKNADINAISTVSGNGEFFCDKKNVYYKDEILPINNSGQLEIVEIPQEDYFLYDRKTGEVFNGTYRFDEKYAPYEVIGNKSTHAHSMFFISKDGLYYYNSKRHRIERSGDNPFNGDVKALTDNVFLDNDKIYYLNAYEEIRYGKHRIPRTFIKHTLLVAFDSKEGWEKIGDIDHGIIGSLWEKNGLYYYFDNLGNSQLIKDTVYKIRDKKVIDDMMSNIKKRSDDKIGVDYIRKAIAEKKMEPISGETISDASVTIYGSKYRMVRVIGFLVVTLLIILGGRDYWNSRKY